MDNRVNNRGTCHTHIRSIWYVWLQGHGGYQWRHLQWDLLWGPYPRPRDWHHHHSQASHKSNQHSNRVLCRGYWRCDSDNRCNWLVFKYSSIQGLKCSSIQVFKYSSIQNSSIQVLKHSSIQVFKLKYSGYQVFKSLSLKVYNLTILWLTNLLIVIYIKFRDPVGSKNLIWSGEPHLAAKHYSNTQSPAVAVRVLIKMKYCYNLQLNIIKYFPHILMYNFMFNYLWIVTSSPTSTPRWQTHTQNNNKPCSCWFAKFIFHI